MVTWEFEESLFPEGNTVVCGVDEAGRGPLAGPVYAAAVILPRGAALPGLDDSKKLSPQKREVLYDRITDVALTYGIASASETEIDTLNILNATYLAMNRAIAKLSIKPDVALIDGNRSTGIECCNQCIVGGDGLSASIAAASILAKVIRDKYMVQLSEEYPEYLFDQHKGYGTKLHYELIKQYGISPVHRLTFLKKMQ